jgi:hypothetical protein
MTSFSYIIFVSPFMVSYVEPCRLPVSVRIGKLNKNFNKFKVAVKSKFPIENLAIPGAAKKLWEYLAPFNEGIYYIDINGLF